jgi:hypothetical protein
MYYSNDHRNHNTTYNFFYCIRIGQRYLHRNLRRLALLVYLCRYNISFVFSCLVNDKTIIAQ